ncbi:MAG: hypothetical protein RML45_00700 [Acetobacteraceae bacterium]|nr:hypothetical protein [Acetobacteraceae bacterium]
MAERLLAARFGRSLVDHRTWVVASAEEVTAGAGHEAASLAGALRLAKLTVLADAAGRHDGSEGAEALQKRFAAYGWATKGIEADDPQQVAAALAYAVRSARPTLILCRTGGVGAEAAEGTDGGVGAGALRAWAEAGRRGARARLAWRRRHQRSPLRDEFDRVMGGRLPETWRAGLDGWRGLRPSERAATATAQASRQALATLSAAIPELVELCAEEGGAPHAPPTDAGAPRPSGRSVATVRVGARRLALGSAMEGLALHGGVIPVADTALACADGLRPALREAALGRRRVILVLSEDRTAGP